MTFDLPVAGDWFSVTWVASRVALLIEPHVDPLLQGNIWYLRGRERDLVIDTGNGIAPLRPVLANLAHGRPRDVIAVATHAHADHAGGLHEFGSRLLHPKETQAAQRLGDGNPLLGETWAARMEHPPSEEELCGEDFLLPPILVDARPSAGFDPTAFRIAAVAATQLVVGGDVIDLGDRQLQVVELPGHTPGSIGLWDEADAALYAGDAIYEGPLLDMLPESSVEDYLRTMLWLRELPAEVVYPGHDEPFGRRRLRQLAEDYLRRRS